jgi:hypothetical protein
VTGVLLERGREQSVELLDRVLELCSELVLPDRARCAEQPGKRIALHECIVNRVAEIVC